MNNETVLKMINKRIDELTDDFHALTKSVKVLNDSHHKTDLTITRIDTEWKTSKAWIKFIFGSSLIGTIVGIVSLLKTFGFI